MSGLPRRVRCQKRNKSRNISYLAAVVSGQYGAGQAEFTNYRLQTRSRSLSWVCAGNAEGLIESRRCQRCLQLKRARCLVSTAKPSGRNWRSWELLIDPCFWCIFGSL